MRGGFACLIAMILSSCASDRLLQDAAQQAGRAQAGRQLPAYPDDCRKKEDHAPLIDGVEARSVLKRERQALDRQNARADRCADFYDGLAGNEMMEDNTMTGERIQKIADSVILRAVARVSMAMVLPLASLVVYFGLNWLDSRFEKQDTASQNAIAFQVSRIDRIEKTATTAIDQSTKVNDRLTIVETKQATADATAAKFQNDALTRLDRMQDSMVGILNAVAALTATMQAREDYERRKSTSPP